MVAMVTGTRAYGGMAMGASWSDPDYAYMVVEFFAFGTFGSDGRKEHDGTTFPHELGTEAGDIQLTRGHCWSMHRPPPYDRGDPVGAFHQCPFKVALCF